MFIAMNRFKVRVGSEADFETVWKNRDSRLSELPGFESFHLLRGATNEEEGYTLYASHTVWRDRDDFVAWTKSEQFRDAHRNAGENKPLYLGPPQFEGFSAVLGS
ncbi:MULTISPECIES: antibiotic biosynthesis monooxygenase [unclassified Ochrobactrum]|uniref:antibiotic biosynthesis monooxygenase family protein n=1 Tax=unclassified Ochrobactrum TaxID=239106 RepID=UPI000DEF2153|nr:MULTISPECIES: antibiotic biosynthesis monooxygenase [unclassified Ochrobactrum]MBQ0707413.1 antibiotic biosynthesis monooxygenase [Ochrobactrum sp. AP1BH01-1]